MLKEIIHNTGENQAYEGGNSLIGNGNHIRRHVMPYLIG